MAIKEVVQVQFDIKDNASGPTKKLGGLMSSLFSPAAIASAAIAGVGFAIGKMISAAEESRKIMAQTDAVLKSTGGAAGITSQRVADLATELSRMTDFDDEAIQSMENLLLTFTKIKGDVFPQATAAVLDMSAALGQDLKSSAIQLGKALNDPIAGLTALRRVGVAFTEQQKQQIQVLVESGRTADAQKIILRELSVEFGGVAKAIASPTVILKNSLQNLYEAIGMRLLPSVKLFSEEITKLINKFTDWLNKGDPFSKYKKSIDSFSASQITQELVKLNKEKERLEKVNNETSILNFFKGKEKKAAIDGIQEITGKVKALSDRLIELKSKSGKSGSSSDEEKPDTSFDAALKGHEANMSEIKASNTYTIDAEIAAYRVIYSEYAKLGDQKAEVNKKINDLITKQNEEATKRTLEQMEMEFARKKALGQTTVADEIAFEQSKLGVKNLSEQQKQDIANKTYQANTQQMLDQLATDQYLNSEEQNWALERDRLAKSGISKNKQDTKTLLDSARALGEGKLTIDEFVNQGLLENKKKEAIAWGDIEAGKLIQAGLASLATLNPFGFLQIAAGAALSTGIRAAANSIKLAKGGDVSPTPGGTLVTVGEAGQTERVAPLDPNGLSQRDYAMIDYLSGGRSQGSGVTEITVMLPDKTALAKVLYREQQRLINTGQLAGAR